MAKADCVILMLADAAAIRAVLLTPTSLAVLRGKIVIQMGTIAQEESMALQAEIQRVGGSYAKHRYWEALPKHKPGTLCHGQWDRRTACPRGSAVPFAESGAASGRSCREGRDPQARAQSIDRRRNIGIRPEPWISAAGRRSRKHLHGDLAEGALLAPVFENKLPRLRLFAHLRCRQPDSTASASPHKLVARSRVR